MKSFHGVNICTRSGIPAYDDTGRDQYEMTVSRRSCPNSVLGCCCLVSPDSASSPYSSSFYTLL